MLGRRKAAMVGRRRKNLKLHWMKRLETVPPKYYQKMIQNLKFGVY